MNKISLKDTGAKARRFLNSIDWHRIEQIFLKLLFYMFAAVAFAALLAVFNSFQACTPDEIRTAPKPKVIVEKVVFDSEDNLVQFNGGAWLQNIDLATGQRLQRIGFKLSNVITITSADPLLQVEAVNFAAPYGVGQLSAFEFTFYSDGLNDYYQNTSSVFYFKITRNAN